MARICFLTRLEFLLILNFKNKMNNPFAYLRDAKPRRFINLPESQIRQKLAALRNSLDALKGEQLTAAHTEIDELKSELPFAGNARHRPCACD